MCHHTCKGWAMSFLAIFSLSCMSCNFIPKKMQQRLAPRLVKTYCLKWLLQNWTLPPQYVYVHSLRHIATSLFVLDNFHGESILLDQQLNRKHGSSKWIVCRMSKPWFLQVCQNGSTSWSFLSAWQDNISRTPTYVRVRYKTLYFSVIPQVRCHWIGRWLIGKSTIRNLKLFLGNLCKLFALWNEGISKSMCGKWWSLQNIVRTSNLDRWYNKIII